MSKKSKPKKSARAGKIRAKKPRQSAGRAGSSAPEAGPTPLVGPQSSTDRVPMEDLFDLQSLDPREAGPLPDKLPILPLRDTVVFPGTIIPLSVGRDSSMRLVNECLPTGKIIGLVTQRDPSVEYPDQKNLHAVGTAGMVLKVIRQPDQTLSLIVHGLERIAIKKVLQSKPYLLAEVTRLGEELRADRKFEAAVKNLRDTAVELVRLTPNAPEQAATIILNIEDPGGLSDFLAANLNLQVDERQALLNETNVVRRVRTVQLHVVRQMEMARLQEKIQKDVQSTITDAQRKMFLREQMKAIQHELGDQEDTAAEQMRVLRERLEAADPPPAVMKEVERELKRLETIPQMSPDFSVSLNYLEMVADLPWNKISEERVDLVRARRILDRDHYDLDKVKRRLVEFLAVRKLNPTGHAPILCFVGPPGVGKTSLGKSMAEALGREFSRISLGGIRDEAEIRGHRRTYIGSMPGRIIQEIRRAGTRNPVMMLDEIDKVGADVRGDPASALLEVLDRAQNHAFMDRYLDVPFDLSQVIFVATANYMDPVPPALHDRMEVIEIPGYTDREKRQIARRYLLPRQMKEHGLEPEHCRWSEDALAVIVEYYTREAGVRSLDRQVASICRAIASRVARRAPGKPMKIDGAFVRATLGPEIYIREEESTLAMPGVANGLAYTPFGGEVLHIEATRYAGRGAITLTGQLGKVMKESVETAWSLVKTRAGRLGIDARRFRGNDLHVHVPAGAVPKDGPSAGIAMYSAIASLFMGRALDPRLAMTGEVTLRGLVLPIGGVKEKTLGAMRAGIKTVLLPEGNRKDLPDIAPEARRKLKFIFVRNVDDVLAAALMKEPKR